MKQMGKLRLFGLSGLLSVFLYACGGGGGFTVADGGITGSGITMMGRITNFGSIIVNGVKFNVDAATFQRDGNSNVAQADFNIGEYVVINGTIDALGTNGVATSVSFENLLEGTVTAVFPNDSRIEILSQSVLTDQLTVFHGFSVLSDLHPGNIVEVSGVRDSNGDLLASSLLLKQQQFVNGVSEIELEGMISNLDIAAQTFSLGNMTVFYGSAQLVNVNTLQNGQFVEARSDTDIVNNIVIATSVELEDEYQQLTENTEAEIEGAITRFASTSDFDVNGIRVTTTSQTEYEYGSASDLALNRQLEVEGMVNLAGVLVAEEIAFRESEESIELEGQIQSVDVNNSEINLQGQVVVLDASTIMEDKNLASFTINDLAPGDDVKVAGVVLSSGKIRAFKLKRENPEDQESEAENDEESEDEESD